MSECKTALHAVTNEEIGRASALWQCGEPFKVIAHKVGWSQDLFWRVTKLCREFDDPSDQHFPARNKERFKVKAAKQGDEAAVVAAKKPVALSLTAWKRALSESGSRPCTVPSRRPCDYTPLRRRPKAVDPTLVLPGAR